MSAPPTRTAPPALGRDALHIVLFGMPAAGKSSLLGALAQAAQTQEHLLNGRLLDTTNGLAELQHRLYDETPRRTVEEVAPFPVVFEPFGSDGQAPGERERIEAVVIDCDGRVANDLLMRRRSLAEGSREGTLAHEVEEADTLILVIDAAAPPTQVDADFAEFSRFLRLFERSRGEQSEVGGLPVFLVLTKCDLLAKPDDTPADWVERIEERKRQVDQRFQDFLARRESEEGPLPFGRIDLHLWATAVKRPALAGVPAKPREPYGVAELFRQCIEHARAFHRRERRASRLLLWTVGGAGAVAVGLVVLTVALLLQGREARPTELQNRVENYRYSEGQTATERLKGSIPYLKDRIAQLEEIKRDPAFASLPPEKQEYVNDLLAEKQAYVAYYLHLQRARAPAEARSDDDLRRIEEALKTKGDDGLAVPRADWAGTPAARLHEERLQDARALRRAVTDVEDWYVARRSEGEKLWAFADRQPGAEAPINWRAWQSDTERFLSNTDRPPYPETARVPEAASDSLTYGATVYRFNRIEEVQADLKKVRDRLLRLRDLTTALGLGGPPEKALLVVPRQPHFTLENASQRLQELRKAYPNFEKDFPAVTLPEAARGHVRQAAKTSYENLLPAGQEAVLNRLQQARGGGKETYKAWQAVRSWLAKDPPELSAWRVLARTLVRLFDPDRGEPDPMAEMVAFLGKDRFELNLRRLTLEIPESLRVRPSADFSIYHPATQPTGPALVYTVGDKQRDAQRGVLTYTLRPKDGHALTYRPGDDLWATLPVTETAKGEMMLTWARSPSLVYQFGRLSRPPHLHRRNEENTQGMLTEGIHLSVPPNQGSLPSLPDLMPVVPVK